MGSNFHLPSPAFTSVEHEASRLQTLQSLSIIQETA